ncbi:hypothetical protein F5J12DRAFT_719186 [Pisolithus orientalis]|uniref:uncharacterized protein n=1 Tax=Pisolithus orientalis TaxID=936130 RepID=UPI002224141E|nr:uncharacterized protein F5J12DRAFT_719186 [Pisolithus orientalis]KAI6009456.1 hypothetical protein F5J12DRAFT_719186 [Pisolithus orientalis]
MPPKSNSECKVVAQWMPVEEEKLVKFLHSHCAEATDGTGNFKPQTYNHLPAANAAYRMPGTPVKTPLQCKNKWRAVGHTFFAQYFQRYCTSGKHWDNDNSAVIVGTDAGQVWDEYTKTHKSLHPYRNWGWLLFDMISEIMPSGVASSHHAFDASAPSMST